jgi:hypothetical protein
LDNGEITTSFRMTREAQLLGRRPRLFAETSRGGGWRGADDGDTSVVDEHGDSAAVKTRERVREERRVERRSLEEERGCGLTCRRRICAETPAGAGNSGERFLGGQQMVSREGKGKGGRSGWGI